MVVFSSVTVQQFLVLEGQVLFLLRHLVQLNWGSFIYYYFTLSTILPLFEYCGCRILPFIPQRDRRFSDLRSLHERGKKILVREELFNCYNRLHRREGTIKYNCEQMKQKKNNIGQLLRYKTSRTRQDVLLLVYFRDCTQRLHLWPPRLFSFSTRSRPSVLQASAWRSQPPQLIPAAGAAAKVLPRTWRGWATLPRSPWTMTPRVCGALTSSRASRRRLLSTHPVAVARSSSPMKARCMVRPLLPFFKVFNAKHV